MLLMPLLDLNEFYQHTVSDCVIEVLNEELETHYKNSKSNLDKQYRTTISIIEDKSLSSVTFTTESL